MIVLQLHSTLFAQNKNVPPFDEAMANLDLSRLPQHPEREKQRLEAGAREQIAESTRQILGRVLELSGTLVRCEQTHKGSNIACEKFSPRQGTSGATTGEGQCF